MEMGHHKKSTNFEVPLFDMSKISAHATRKFSNYSHRKLVPHRKAKSQYRRLFEESVAKSYLDLKRVFP